MTDAADPQPSSDGITAALNRQLDAARQIREHGGPVHVKHHERSITVHDAWVAAGSPVRVAGWAGPTPFLYAQWKRERQIVPATAEQVAAWRAWVTARAALRLTAGRPADPAP